MIRLLFLCLLLVPSVASAVTWTHTGAWPSSSTFPWIVSCAIEHPSGTPQVSVGLSGVSAVYDPSYTGSGLLKCTNAAADQFYTNAMTFNGSYYYRVERDGVYWHVEYSTNYIPPPTEPETCSNGVLDADETGLDCGDPLCVDDGDDVCTTYCPVGFNVETRPPDNITACYSDDSNIDYYALVKLDQCPDDMFHSATDDELCVSWTLATFASSDYLDGVDSPDIDTTPWNNVTNDEITTVYNTVTFDGGISTEFNSETIESTTSDGSAAEQITTETTVTQVDGSSITTSVVESNVLSSDGSVTGQTVTTVSTFDSSGVLLGSTTETDTIESTLGSGDSFRAPSSGVFEVDQELFDSFTVRYEEFYSEIENAPIYTPVSNLFSGPDTSSKSADFSLAMGSYGTKSFALSTYDQVWNALGVLFIFLATITTARMIMVRGFSGGN